MADGAGSGVDVPVRAVLGPAVEGFPRRQKFLLGDRLQTTALDVLERPIDATYTRDRQTHLAAANLGIEELRFLFRLAKDLHHLDMRRYTYAARAGRPVRWHRPGQRPSWPGGRRAAVGRGRAGLPVGAGRRHRVG